MLRFVELVAMVNDCCTVPRGVVVRPMRGMPRQTSLTDPHHTDRRQAACSGGGTRAGGARVTHASVVRDIGDIVGRRRVRGVHGIASDDGDIGALNRLAASAREKYQDDEATHGDLEGVWLQRSRRIAIATVLDLPRRGRMKAILPGTWIPQVSLSDYRVTVR